ncbi:16S rRNA (guanine(527)-N(7))-methyltransferase RsmG [Methylococcus geothermalis]|uniref:Ribosomal RNA small subunit methyltransferase G n=1 Tax=Methylococcus geothermalis TaxID=2681310 RepID=A0A858Q547_9GAMM|nr:16S rRNA (guanine(527)-N(7))-methyltransferase RsmG [Methylococcus geothermalis]QJD28923.1 16S rRNA (guanine(527)-N(7))-methyltransferase RsmG [Methylococcus geothermalis]
MPLTALLEQGLSELGLSADPGQRRRLLHFVELLRKWNRVYNLTAIEDPRESVQLHLLDSLSVAPYLHGERVLDVGTGAGLPGIPLAIVQPERRFVLLDCNAKKIRFVHQVVIELGLSNVAPVQARVESFSDATGFDCVLARAYAALAEIWADASPLLKAGGAVLALKGRRPEAELGALPAGIAVGIHRLRVPGVDAERHLAELRATGQDS